MKELTKAEEQIMQILWNLDEAFVKEVIDKMPDPKPAYNTVSTIVRILEKKVSWGIKLTGNRINIIHCYQKRCTRKPISTAF